MPLLSARLPFPATPAGAVLRWRYPDPRLFAADLAALGAVFCAWPEPRARASLSDGAASPDLRVLVNPGRLAHACAVTGEGPREWITIHDGADVPRCRLHLLPDTDYLAWDALLAHTAPAPAPGRQPPWRACRGRRLRFDAARSGSWSLQWARPPSPDGPLTRRMLHELVRLEGVSLLA